MEWVDKILEILSPNTQFLIGGFVCPAIGFVAYKVAEAVQSPKKGALVAAVVVGALTAIYFASVLAKLVA